VCVLSDTLYACVKAYLFLVGKEKGQASLQSTNTDLPNANGHPTNPLYLPLVHLNFPKYHTLFFSKQITLHTSSFLNSITEMQLLFLIHTPVISNQTVHQSLLESLVKKKGANSFGSGHFLTNMPRTFSCKLQPVTLL
jgi:hypothetical protein